MTLYALLRNLWLFIKKTSYFYQFKTWKRTENKIKLKQIKVV